jgi:hypothetical protein
MPNYKIIQKLILLIKTVFLDQNNRISKKIGRFLQAKSGEP